MKMSEVFVLPVKSKRVNVVVCERTVIDPDKPGNMDVADDYAAHAINNHDAIVECLREMVNRAIDECHAVGENPNDDIQIVKANELLSKLDGE